MHNFIPSIGNPEECAKCKRNNVAHGPDATCDCCSNTGPMEIVFGNMLMCPDCIEREKKTSAENSTPEKQQERVDAMYATHYTNAALEASRKVDNSITIRTDLFTAATQSIIQLKEIIDMDTNIVNKPYALAEELKNRFEHFKSVIFEMNEKIVEAGNQQKAIQIYLNQLADKLRVEEREKLQIANINYNPTKVKPVKIASIKTKSSKKIDKVALKALAKELGVGEFIIQTIVVSKGVDLETAGNILRKSINEAKSESTASK